MSLTLKKVPISVCSTSCPKCKYNFVEYAMFGSGAGGVFETLVDMKTGKLYRVDSALVVYGQVSEEDYLEEIQNHAQGQIKKIPDGVTCNSCGEIFCATSSEILREEEREVFVYAV